MFYKKIGFIRVKWGGGLNKKQKEGVLTTLVTVIK